MNLWLSNMVNSAAADTLMSLAPGHLQLQCCIMMMPWHKKCFPHYWPFVRGIQQWLLDSPHKGPVMWIFDVSLLLTKQAVEQTVNLLIWEAMSLIWRYCNVMYMTTVLPVHAIDQNIWMLLGCLFSPKLMTTSPFNHSQVILTCFNGLPGSWGLWKIHTRGQRVMVVISMSPGTARVVNWLHNNHQRMCGLFLWALNEWGHFTE